MNIQDYSALKDKDLVELRGLGNDRVAVEITRFDSLGEMLPTESDTITADPDAIAKSIKVAEEQLETARKGLSDLKVFYDDVTAANEAWKQKAANAKKAAEITGKATTEKKK